MVVDLDDPGFWAQYLYNRVEFPQKNNATSLEYLSIA